MPFKNMTAEEKVTVSAAWVDPKNDAHAKLQAEPLLKALLPFVAGAHEGLSAVVRKDDPRSAESARNQWLRMVNALISVAALAQLDETTDRIVFGPLRDAAANADARFARSSAASARASIDPVEVSP